MQIFVGKEGLNKSYQDPFPAVVDCSNCGHPAKIMFVAFETLEDKKHLICDLYKDDLGDNEYWLHDLCATAVYHCACCFEATALVNQG